MGTVAAMSGKGWRIFVSVTVTVFLAMAIFALHASPASHPSR